jgi:hypothetical protein
MCMVCNKETGLFMQESDVRVRVSGEGGPAGGMGRTQRKKGTAGWKQAGTWLATP